MKKIKPWQYLIVIFGLPVVLSHYGLIAKEFVFFMFASVPLALLAIFLLSLTGWYLLAPIFYFFIKRNNPEITLSEIRMLATTQTGTPKMVLLYIKLLPRWLLTGKSPTNEELLRYEEK